MRKDRCLAGGGTLFSMTESRNDNYRFPARPLLPKGELLRTRLGRALLLAVHENDGQPAQEAARLLRTAAGCGDAGMVFAALAQPFGEGAGHNTLTFLLDAHTPGNTATAVALDAVMGLHESLHSDTSLSGHVDMLWWSIDPGHGSAVDLARRSGDAALAARFDGKAWTGGLQEGLGWVFNEARLAHAGQATFDSGAAFLMKWLHLGHYVDTPALVLQRVPGVATGCDSQGRGLAEVAALGFLEDDIWVERMEALAVAMCRRGISDDEAGILCVAGLHALRNHGREGQDCGRRMLASLDRGRGKDWRGHLLEAARATSRLPCSEAADKHSGLTRVWSGELDAWTPGNLPGCAAEVMDAVLSHRGARLGLVSSQLLGKPPQAQGDWAAWLPRLPARGWLGRVLATCAEDFSAFAQARPRADCWWLEPGFLGPALQSLPDDERQAGLAALMRFAPAARARLDAERLEQGRVATHGRRRA